MFARFGPIVVSHWKETLCLCLDNGQASRQLAALSYLLWFEQPCPLIHEHDHASDWPHIAVTACDGPALVNMTSSRAYSTRWTLERDVHLHMWLLHVCIYWMVNHSAALSTVAGQIHCGTAWEWGGLSPRLLCQRITGRTNDDAMIWQYNLQSGVSNIFNRIPHLQWLARPEFCLSISH